MASLADLMLCLSLLSLKALRSVGTSAVRAGVPKPSELREPVRWLSWSQHQVTIWNSAPALLKMFVDYVTGPTFGQPSSPGDLGGDWTSTLRIAEHSAQGSASSLWSD
jgi:non-ribosomal peptide synthetase component F